MVAAEGRGQWFPENLSGGGEEKANQKNPQQGKSPMKK